jgi:hypothetical protein
MDSELPGEINQLTATLTDSSTPPKAPPVRLYAAMAKARSQMKQPKMDGGNPHFNSRYLTLAGLLEAVMPALAENGIHVFQVPVDDVLLTVVTHESGDSVEYRSKMPPAKDPQQLGSILTYFRRYTLSGIIGIAGDIDDDAESAMPRSGNSGGPKVAAVNPSRRGEL